MIYPTDFEVLRSQQGGHLQGDGYTCNKIRKETYGYPTY
ncbi:conserved hypothetical protein [Xenorhabdus nematophila F1]|nr:conserved hypothetical protein [Xenorhabdus nematophila F1]